MQAIEAYIRWYLHAAQDRRLDIVERDLGGRRWSALHAATLRCSISAAQCHGRSSGSLLCGMSAMRASTSASQACGSTSLSFAVMINVAMAAARSAPRSEPANSQTFAPAPLPVHSAHVRQELEVHYRWHPYFGSKVGIRRVEQRATGRFLKVLGPAGVVVSIAEWMLDPIVCAGMTIGAPRVDLAALIELERLLIARANPADSQAIPRSFGRKTMTNPDCRRRHQVGKWTCCSTPGDRRD